MKDKKLVFFDIDGTIYKFNSGIPKDTIESIKKMKENGHVPVICTGRTKVMIYDDFLEPGFDYIIGGAGTYVECNDNTEFLYEMSTADIDEVLKILVSNNFSPVIEGKDNIFIEYSNNNRSERGNKIISNYIKNIGDKCIDISDAKDIRASKISAVFLPDSKLDVVKNKLSEKYNVVDHNGDLLELIPKPYSKATGIKVLMDKLNIPWENTYAFGDSFNDLEMLTFVKYGICMGNSHPDLFKYTKYKTQDFDKGGITNALKEFGII